ncbi:hypothetical protein SAMN05518847_102368 [Paenibacillus sp. OV219]|nr:hypothetical protein SAMN05518847_102368 [Paenibacillus sp. OV219]
MAKALGQICGNLCRIMQSLASRGLQPLFDPLHYLSEMVISPCHCHSQYILIDNHYHHGGFGENFLFL